YQAVLYFSGFCQVAMTVCNQFWRSAGNTNVGFDGAHVVHVLGIGGNAFWSKQVQTFLTCPPASAGEFIDVMDMIGMQVSDKQVVDVLRYQCRHVVTKGGLSGPLYHAASCIEYVG